MRRQRGTWCLLVVETTNRRQVPLCLLIPSTVSQFAPCLLLLVSYQIFNRGCHIRESTSSCYYHLQLTTLNTIWPCIRGLATAHARPVWIPCTLRSIFLWCCMSHNTLYIHCVHSGPRVSHCLFVFSISQQCCWTKQAMQWFFFAFSTSQQHCYIDQTSNAILFSLSLLGNGTTISNKQCNFFNQLIKSSEPTCTKSLFLLPCHPPVDKIWTYHWGTMLPTCLALALVHICLAPALVHICLASALVPICPPLDCSLAHAPDPDPNHLPLLRNHIHPRRLQTILPGDASF